MWKEYLDKRLSLPWLSKGFKNAYINNPTYGPVNEMWGRHNLALIDSARKKQGKNVYGLHGGVTEVLEKGELVRAGAPGWILEPVREGLASVKGWNKKEAELKTLIADWYSKSYNVDIDSGSEVALVVGGAFGVDSAVRVTAGAGDDVIIMDPDYVTYMPQVASTGANIVSVPLKEEKGEWSFNIEEFEKRVNPRCKLLLMSNANNPSGFFYTQEDLEAIAKLAIKYDFLVFHDQVAEEFVLDNDQRMTNIVSIPGMKERTIMASSFSKMYHCGNFRTGWIVANRSFCEAALLYRGWSNDGNVKPAIDASLAILREDNKKERRKWVKNKNSSLRKKRDYMKRRLSQIDGITPNTCRGHYWAWPNVSSFKLRSQELAEYLLRDYGVYCRPGTWYGKNGEGHFRLNFSVPTEYMDEALNRMEEGLNNLSH